MLAELLSFFAVLLVLPWSSLQFVKNLIQSAKSAYGMLEMVSSSLQKMELQCEEALQHMQNMNLQSTKMQSLLENISEKTDHLAHLNMRANAAEMRQSLAECRIQDFCRHLQQALMRAEDDVSVEEFTAEVLSLEIDFEKACSTVEGLKFIEIFAAAMIQFKSRLLNQKALKMCFERDGNMQNFRYIFGKNMAAKTLQMLEDTNIEICKRVWSLEMLKDLKANSLDLMQKDCAFFEIVDADGLSMKLLKTELAMFKTFMVQHQHQGVNLEALQIDGQQTWSSWR